MRSNNLEHERVKSFQEQTGGLFIPIPNRLHERFDRRRSVPEGRLGRIGRRFGGNGRQCWCTSKMTAQFPPGYIFRQKKGAISCAPENRRADAIRIGPVSSDSGFAGGAHFHSARYPILIIRIEDENEGGSPLSWTTTSTSPVRGGSPLSWTTTSTSPVRLGGRFPPVSRKQDRAFSSSAAPGTGMEISFRHFTAFSLIQ
jgi:hypothetical protein